MLSLVKGRYRARLAQDASDIARAQGLRHRRFVARNSAAQGVDADVYDAACRHVLLEECASGALVGCYRLLLLPPGGAMANSYSAQFYDLSALDAFAGAKLELGRFCLDPGWHDPDILRLAWGAMARMVDDLSVTLLFGCSSFEGSDPARHQMALALLTDHLAPPMWQPLPKAVERHALMRAAISDRKTALLGVPPLLRTYLGMGGWVSDHAVIDRALDTLHVFTGIEIARIPPARARALRAIAN